MRGNAQPQLPGSKFRLQQIQQLIVSDWLDEVSVDLVR
jgi:hypothetical protein